MTYQPQSKRLAKNVLLLYLRMFLMMLIGLYTSRVVLSVLGVSDFGIYNVVGGVVSMFSFLNAGLTVSSQRYLTFELGRGDTRRLQQVFATSLQIHLAISLLIVLLVETVGLWFLYHKMVIPPERMTAAFWCLQFSVFTIVVSIMSYPYNAAIIAHERMSAFAYISLIDAVLKLLLVYLLLLSDADRLITYALLFALEKLLIRSIYNGYCVRHFAECTYRHRFDRCLFKEMFAFAGWNMWGNLACICYTDGLNMLLNVFFGPVVNAARAVAVQVQGSIGNLAANFHMAINPQITKAYASGQMGHVHTLVYHSSRFTFCLLWICCLPVIMQASQVLTWWLATPPEYADTFMRITLLTMMVECTANPLVTALAATGRVRKCELVTGTTQLCILPVSYVALSLGAAPWSVFIVHQCISILTFGVRLAIVRPMIRLPLSTYLRTVVLRCVLMAAVSLLLPCAVQWLCAPSAAVSVGVMALSFVSAAAAAYGLALDAAERRVVRAKVQAMAEKILRRAA